MPGMSTATDAAIACHCQPPMLIVRRIRNAMLAISAQECNAITNAGRMLAHPPRSGVMWFRFYLSRNMDFSLTNSRELTVEVAWMR
jgi:hypothetical protein